MQEYLYTITLTADAEPSTGTGDEHLNSQLPRNEQNCVMIPGSHLKGLMRENLLSILSGFRNDAAKIVETLFGKEGESGDGGKRSLVRIGSAVASSDAGIITITRTALEDGHVKNGALRTTEALAAGTELSGEIVCDLADDNLLKAVRMALLSVTSVGGSRTRGAGECRIVIKEHEKETPGQLFRDVVKADIAFPSETIAYCRDFTALSGKTVMCKVSFEAKQPVCIPERPMGKSNVITTGFAIPGSAVAGTLLTLMSSADPDVASACFNSKVFRCFPLLPVGDNKCNYPVRVSNSHKVSKLPQGDGDEKKYLFGDQMIPDKYLSETDYHWQKETRGQAMKGPDGVLLVGEDASVSLLKSDSIPKVFSAHGVVNGTGTKKDNLFSREAVSVSAFEGIAFLPEQAADLLCRQVGSGVSVAFGKSKSTMGGGMLTVKRADISFQQINSLRNRLFIVQTPVVFELDDVKASSSDIMKAVLRDAGWGELENESVMTSVIFGWNELNLEKTIDRTHRVQARRVIMPGSVFLLKDAIPDDKLEAMLAEGLGSDRTPGFGAVIPHPMFAGKLVEVNKTTEIRKFGAVGNNDPVYAGYDLNDMASRSKLSASQIARLLHAAQASAKNGYKDALDFLEVQKLSRPKQTWECWEPVYEALKNYLKQNNFDAVTMLKVWLDLRKGRKG